jgi:16S rRNA (cytosine1402-N4)-methyltransferase
MSQEQDDTAAAAVVEALRKLARPSSPEEVAAATGLAEKSVRRTLGHLVARREARRAGGGRFEERYKELDPERFPGEQEKVIARGDTPAGQHLPVMLDEALAALRPAPGGVVLDCTLGRGGHARALAARVAPGGVVLALDRDADELARTAAQLEKEGVAVRARATNFAGAAKALAAEGLDGADCVLADLGVSSMQIDRAERGFSFKEDGPLDMRMDRSRGATAAEWLAEAREKDIARVLKDHGDEPAATAIAAAIARRVAAGPPLATTGDLADVVLRAQGIDPRTFRQAHAYQRHPAARTFQALRIVVNREDEALAQLLRDLPWILRPGGRAALITFHSGEERRVAAAFAQGREAGLYASASDAPVAPSPEERRRNPRSRSARLSWAVRA